MLQGVLLPGILISAERERRAGFIAAGEEEQREEEDNVSVKVGFVPLYLILLYHLGNLDLNFNR